MSSPLSLPWQMQRFTKHLIGNWQVYKLALFPALGSSDIRFDAALNGYFKSETVPYQCPCRYTSLSAVAQSQTRSRPWEGTWRRAMKFLPICTMEMMRVLPSAAIDALERRWTTWIMFFSIIKVTYFASFPPISCLTVAQRQKSYLYRGTSYDCQAIHRQADYHAYWTWGFTITGLINRFSNSLCLKASFQGLNMQYYRIIGWSNIFTAGML